MNYLAFLRKSKAAYLVVIIGLFCVNFPKNAIANPNKIPIAAVLLPTVDSLTHLKQAQSILNAIRAELLKEKFPVMDSNYSAQLIARKQRAWLKKCSYSPKCLGELGQKLNATILLSGNLEKSPTKIHIRLLPSFTRSRTCLPFLVSVYLIIVPSDKVTVFFLGLGISFVP